jgi:hypothetical protein
MREALYRAFGHALAWLFGVAIGVDVLVNAVCGGMPYTTISCRVGTSMANGGWASRIRWPAWWVAHCKAAIFTTTV